MSISASHASNYTLFRRARSTPWRRALVALFAVPAVLIGLLAMHALAASGDSTSHPAEMSAIATMPQMTDSIPPTTAAGACYQFCGPTHDMGATACVLALLLTALTVAALIAFRGWASVGAALTAIAALVARPRALAPPFPPCLELLSISRI